MAAKWGLTGRFGLVLRVAAIAIAVLVLLPYVIAPFYRFINPVSTLMLWRQATGQRVERQWMPIERISPALRLAVIVAEDGKFCSHHGIDFGELRQALTEVDDLSEARGGSTITQQVAKNLFLWQSRSYVRKALEFPLALWIDLVLPKKRVLEIYLNIAAWGPNGEFGAEAGARRDFNKSAADLRPSEAALMAATLPNPRTRNARKPSPGLRRIAGIHLHRMGTMAGQADCVGIR
jgi:monofunctional biosynthetic peptidoglycan transglycosylase